MFTFHDTVWLNSSVVLRYLTFNARNSINTPFVYGEMCNEMYFHRPWIVPDTFYVVVRYCQDKPYDPEGRYKRLYLLTPYEWPIAYSVVEDDAIPTVFYPSPYDTSTILLSTPSIWGREFPILEPNRTRCRKPTGLHLTERGDTWAALAWNGGSGDSYRVTVEGPDTSFVRETADTTLLLQDLLPDVLYRAEVQSLCRYQYNGFDSTFVNPGSMRVGFQLFGNGIDDPIARPQIALSPNPASHLVEVASSLPMTRIDIVDAVGRVVASFAEANASQATLDVSALPAGVYLLRIHTPAGPISHKLLLR